MEIKEKIIAKSNFWANLFKAPSDKTDLEDVLLSMPPFKEFNRKYIKLFMKLIHHRVYEPNEFVFYQGDPGLCLYIIREGEVLISQTDENQNEIELVSFNRGDFFGELALIDSERRSASAIAVKETNIAVIFKPDLDEFMEKYPKQGIMIMRGFSKIISTRLKTVNQDFMNCFKELQRVQREMKMVEE